MRKEHIASILPEKFRVNIDTVDFSIKGVKMEMDGVTKATITNSDGEVMHTISNRKTVPGKKGGHALHVRFKDFPGCEEGELFVEGSPFAFRYGQNVFTSASLRAACVPTFRQLSRLLKFCAEAETTERWEAGDIELHRVDLAVNFKLASEEQVGEVIGQLKQQMASQRCQSQLHLRSASWAPRGGKRYSVTAYAKGSQMRSKGANFQNDDIYQRLLDDCACILRVEVRLRRSELTSLGLGVVGKWGIGTPQEVFRKYFGRLPLKDVTVGPLSGADFEGVSARMRAPLALHKNRVNWRLVYSARTRSRHKSYFKARGIDLDCPSQELSAISLPEILSRKGAILKTPQWLIDAGMARPRMKKLT